MLKEDYEYVNYSFGGVKVELTKASTSCRAKVCIDSRLYRKSDIRHTKEFRDYNNTLHLTIKSVKAYDSIIKTGYIVTKWFGFNIKWHKLEYKAIPQNICLKLKNDDVELSLTVPKNKFIPKDWVGSYANYMERIKYESDPRKRTGYVNNRTRADYTSNNIHNPFLGGKVSPK